MGLLVRGVAVVLVLARIRFVLRRAVSELLRVVLRRVGLPVALVRVGVIPLAWATASLLSCVRRRSGDDSRSSRLARMRSLRRKGGGVVATGVRLRRVAIGRVDVAARGRGRLIRILVRRGKRASEDVAVRIAPLVRSAHSDEPQGTASARSGDKRRARRSERRPRDSSARLGVQPGYSRPQRFDQANKEKRKELEKKVAFQTQFRPNQFRYFRLPGIRHRLSSGSNLKQIATLGRFDSEKIDSGCKSSKRDCSADHHSHRLMSHS